jgi:hypothetical protein
MPMNGNYTDRRSTLAETLLGIETKKGNVIADAIIVPLWLKPF